MAFGLKNAPARFQRLINPIINGLDGVEAYLDDLIVHSNSWEEHLRILQDCVLCAPDFDKEFKLAVDASDAGAGAVLLQESDDKIVAYFSKKFNKHQRNYSTIEKEALALVLAIQHFVVYVSSWRKPLQVFTDHNPLTFIEKMKDKNRRILNCSLLLQEHNLCINHIKRCDNVIADALSRC